MGSDQSGVEVARRSVLLQLDKILSSRYFGNCPRSQRFLAYVVNHVVSGSPEIIKEFALGLEVFDKGQQFDPRVDCVVRVQARRVRQRLLAYYTEDGRFDPIIVHLPQGTYVPVIRIRPVADRPAANALQGKAIAVLSFTCPEGDLASRTAAEIIADDLVSPLSALGLRVLGARVPLTWRGQTPTAIGRRFGVHFLITGSVHKTGDRLRVHAQLIDAHDGFTVCSETLYWETGQFLNGVENIGPRLVTSIAHSLGRPVAAGAEGEG